MNQSVPLYMVLAVVGVNAGVLVLYLVHRWLNGLSARLKAVADSMLEADQTLETVNASLGDLRHMLEPVLKCVTDAAEEFTEHMPGIPKLLEGVSRIGQAQVEVLQQQRRDQAEREKNPFGRTSGPLPPRDVEAANQEHQIQEIMRATGASREEVLLQMNPANTASVWDGDRLTEGWGR